MKKVICLLLALYIMLNFGACKIENDVENEPNLLAVNGDYEHQLFDNCAIMGGNINEYMLMYNDNVMYKGSFYKYSSFDNRYVAIHNMNLVEVPDDSDNSIKFSMDTVKIEKDCFVIFDAENQSITEFESIESFNVECEENNLNFENWYFRENKSQKIQITDNCYIEDAGDYRGQILYYNNLPVLEGVISLYEFTDDNLTFEFKIVDSDFGPEFPEITNQNLNLKEFQSSKKYHVEGLLFYNMIYEAYIVFNTKTGEFNEYKNKAEYLTV